MLRSVGFVVCLLVYFANIYELDWVWFTVFLSLAFLLSAFSPVLYSG